jgi:hypothetical protein
LSLLGLNFGQQDLTPTGQCIPDEHGLKNLFISKVFRFRGQARMRMYLVDIHECLVVSLSSLASKQP